MRRPSISIRALIVGIAAGAPAPALATAVCGNFSANHHYFVGAGQSCTAPAGSYTPVATGTTILPFNDPGYGFVTYAGGQLTTRGAVTIATPASAGATAALSTGAGSLITLTNGATLTTTAANANGVQADTGGAVTLGAAAVTTTVTTSGAGALGLYSTGANSQINATNVAVSTSGVGANAAFATSGGAITLNGGSAQTGGLDAYALAVGAGGTMQATGTAVTTTGAGSGGISVNGSTASFTGSNLTINITGATDTVNQFFPTGLDNQSYKTDVGGGTATLTNSTITVAANGGSGVFTTNAGSTTIIGGSVATSGVAAYGVLGEGGSATTLTGVTIGSTGAGGRGVVFEGAGTTLNGAGLTISTAGNYSSGEADAVYVNSGATATLSNSQLTTTGNAAKGINVEGTATTFTGYNLTISTSGTIDAGTGFHAQGVYNGSAASPGTGTTGGGVVYLENTSVTTAGAIAYGVDTDNKGTTTFVGGRIATSGAGAIALLSSNGASVTVTPFMQEGEEAPFGQAIGTVISTSAASTEAAVANTGSTMSITGATLSTTGAGAIALAVNDAGTHVTLTDVVINTTGNVDPGTGDAADGVYNGPSSKGTSGGSVTLNNVQVTTTGTSADGIATYTGGVTTVNGGSLTTSGAAAYAAVVHNTGSLSLDNVTISTSGNGSGGVGINGAGASATLTNVSITTTGGFDSASGQHAYGVYNGPYGSLASGRRRHDHRFFRPDGGLSDARRRQLDRRDDDFPWRLHRHHRRSGQCGARGKWRIADHRRGRRQSKDDAVHRGRRRLCGDRLFRRQGLPDRRLHQHQRRRLGRPWGQRQRLRDRRDRRDDCDDRRTGRKLRALHAYGAYNGPNGSVRQRRRAQPDQRRHFDAGRRHIRRFHQRRRRYDLQRRFGDDVQRRRPCGLVSGAGAINDAGREPQSDDNRKRRGRNCCGQRRRRQWNRLGFDHHVGNQLRSHGPQQLRRRRRRRRLFHYARRGDHRHRRPRRGRSPGERSSAKPGRAASSPSTAR